MYIVITQQLKSIYALFTVAIEDSMKLFYMASRTGMLPD